MGIGVWSQVGRRVIVRFLFEGPTSAVRSVGSDIGGSVDGGRSEEMGTEVSADGGEVMKSVREGPVLRRSLKVVVGRRMGGLGFGASVANEREQDCRLREDDVVCDEYKQRNRDTLEAMMGYKG